MSKNLNADVLQYGVGGPTARSYVTADPRTGAGLAATIGSQVWVTVTGGQASYPLYKYASWDTAWRPPGEGPLWPDTTALFKAYTKLDMAAGAGALYMCDAQLTPVLDVSGNGATLTGAGTPLFGRAMATKAGFYLSTSISAVDADVNDPAANSFVYGAVVAMVSNIAAGSPEGIIGRLNGTADGAALYFSPGGPVLTILLRDAAGTLVQANHTGIDLIANGNQAYLCQMQIDKVANLARTRVSRVTSLGVPVSASIAALGTFTKAGQRFGFGAIPAGGPVLNGGGMFQLGYYAKGAQCAGANVLRDIAVGLGWEV